jgi:hypothetical protein
VPELTAAASSQLSFGFSPNSTLDNTIVAGNYVGSTLNDISGAVSASLAPTSANNLIDSLSFSGGLTDGTNGNIIGVAPGLLPLGNYGGPTETMPPAPGSPAIDRGNPAVAAVQGSDQRGFSRIIDGTVDIGAVEFQPTSVGTYLQLQGPFSANHRYLHKLPAS